MAERAYTVREIDDMRRSVRTLARFGAWWHFRRFRPDGEVSATEIEERLRTYMLHGTAPEELAAEADRVLAEYKAEREAKKLSAIEHG